VRKLTQIACDGTALPSVVHRHWAPIFLLVPTARIGIGRHAPVGTGIVRAAWPPKAANGSKNKPRVSSRSLTSIASSLYRQNLIPWSWPTSADFTPCSLSAPHRACWSLGATDSRAIWESLPCYIPGDSSSTSIPLQSGRDRVDHARQRGGQSRLLLPGHFRCLPDPLRIVFQAIPQP
jgi:hypothetical protein